MTYEEVQIVAKIMCSADGGCHVCADKLLHLFLRSFPEHTEIVQESYYDYHGLPMSTDDDPTP